MTAAQKANQLRFKKVQAEAKKLKAKNKKLTHIQAVKQAWAIILKTGKSKKIAAVKIIQKGEKKNAKVTKVLQQTRTKKGLFKGYKKVAGTKTHKDTKSHNVNIRVVSGIVGAFNNLEKLINEKEKAENKIYNIKGLIKGAGDIETKNHYKFWLKRYKSYLLGLKKQITEAKKHI
jgi:hypothetical protein